MAIDLLKSINPATGEVTGEIPATDPGEVRQIVDNARKVSPEWAGLTVGERCKELAKVRHAIYQRIDDIADTVSLECGKPRAEALITDVLPAVLTLAYTERTAPGALRPKKIGRLIAPLFGSSSRVEWKPFGVVGCITAWNYPFNLAFASMTCALAAGNVIVIKPTEVTPRVGELIREVLSVLPSGVAQVIQGGAEVGAALVDAPVDKISFIGSATTGRKIAESAAKHLTPVVMELGGIDAAIVLEDADLDTATSGILWGSFMNAGQTCCSIERAYVVDSVADRFTEKLLEKLTKVDAGGTDIGPLTFSPQRDIVKRHVDDAISKGAQVLYGGPPKEETSGFWYPPTVLGNIGEEMDLSREETFGPVLPIVRVRDEDEAVRRANEDGFNLTASVWTGDRRRAERIASRLQAGTVGINDHGATEGLPWTPWGGLGESGYGRLNGVLGLMEFSVPVHVFRNLMPGVPRPWWYPYEDQTVAMLRGLTDALSAPTLKGKVAGARELARNAVPALRKKL